MTNSLTITGFGYSPDADAFYCDLMDDAGDIVKSFEVTVGCSVSRAQASYESLMVTLKCSDTSPNALYEFSVTTLKDIPVSDLLCFARIIDALDRATLQDDEIPLVSAGLRHDGQLTFTI